ncbi:INO80 complex subunit B [Coemansia sp. RSA 1722]|nr:INO80 complex subunit B [Coemansia sp. RSA 486]KAJ2227095.1 INO80 complex subunit B [Coemansia sp. RSA 485]KAJ2595601.1 INO80 complex subunit B [Coemansia sp. RSA 1722]
MPRTRRAARGTTTDTWGSSPLSSGSASASDSDAASDSNAGSTPPPTRGRRAGTQTPAGSPATNTRRSSRLSAQTERSPAPKPAGRLTRGLRGGAKSGSGAPRGRLTTRGGLRGRRRAISSPTSDEGSVAKRARGPGKRGRPRNTGSDDSQSTDDAEESDEADESPQDIEEDAGEEEESSTSDGDGQADDAEDSVQSDGNISTSSELSVRSDAGSERDAKQQQEARVDGTNSGESDNEGLAAGGSDSEGSQQSDSAASDAEDAVGPQQARKEGRRQGRPPKTAPSSRGGRGRGRGGRGPGRPRTNPPPPQQPEPTPPPPPQELSDGDSSIVDGMSLDGLSDIGDYSNATGAASLTRRQRAKLTQDYDEELIELPLEAKRSKFSAEEAALRKSEHARRRKFQSLQRAEQLKNDTINRLLNKQTSKGRNKVAEDSETRDGSADVADAAPGSVRYVQRCTAASHRAHIEHTLSLARDVAIDMILPAATLKDNSPQYPPPAPMCSMTGCAETKRYSVASLAACSLEHWRILSAQSKAQNAE